MNLKIKLIIALALLILFYWCWYIPQEIVQPNPNCGVVKPKVKKAIYKMGPGYNYKMYEGHLYVNTGDGKWKHLKY